MTNKSKIEYYPRGEAPLNPYDKKNYKATLNRPKTKEIMSIPLVGKPTKQNLKKYGKAMKKLNSKEDMTKKDWKKEFNKKFEMDKRWGNPETFQWELANDIKSFAYCFFKKEIKRAKENALTDFLAKHTHQINSKEDMTKQKENWEEEARRYANNADFWRKKYEKEKQSLREEIEKIPNVEITYKQGNREIRTELKAKFTKDIKKLL